MKVLAINGSPKKAAGNTHLILKPFLQGMAEAGAEVELVYTYDLTIHFCRGSCDATHPGCIQQDDMQPLYGKLLEADIWVFATPVYTDGVTASLKNLMDRMAALLDKRFEIRNGDSRHPPAKKKMTRVILIASCGFWGLKNFDPLMVHFRASSENGSRDFAGALLRPHCRVLRMMADCLPDQVHDIFSAAQEAGRQVVTQGTIDPQTRDAVQRELLSLEEFVAKSNQLLKAKYL